MLIYEAMIDYNKCCRRLWEAELKLASEKCNFVKQAIEYVGNVINRTRQGKIESIRKWKLPEYNRELQTFLGFCKYYGDFIKDSATLSDPLSAMLKNDNKFTWSENAKSAFYGLQITKQNTIMRLQYEDIHGTIPRINIMNDYHM